MPNYLEFSEEGNRFMENELQYWEVSDKCLLQRDGLRQKSKGRISEYFSAQKKTQ